MGNEPEVFIDYKHFRPQSWVYLDKIYIINYNPVSLANSVLIADMSLKFLFSVDLESTPTIFRHNYSLVGNDNYKLYIYGGVDNMGMPLGTLETFDVCQYQWNLVETRGNEPKPRHLHTAHIIRNTMFIIGGSTTEKYEDPGPEEQAIFVLNLDLHEWLPVGEIGGTRPANLSQHISQVLDESTIIVNL